MTWDERYTAALEAYDHAKVQAWRAQLEGLDVTKLKARVLELSGDILRIRMLMAKEFLLLLKSAIEGPTGSAFQAILRDVIDNLKPPHAGVRATQARDNMVPV